MFEQCLHMDISTMEDLQTVFNTAKRTNLELGLYITVPGSNKEEIVINPPENLDYKLEYYKKSYNNDLTLKAFNQIRITKVMVPLIDENIYLQAIEQ